MTVSSLNEGNEQPKLPIKISIKGGINSLKV